MSHLSSAMIITHRSFTLQKSSRETLQKMVYFEHKLGDISLGGEIQNSMEMINEKLLEKWVFVFQKYDNF